MREWPKLMRGTLADIFNWCQRIEATRQDDIKEYARLQQIAAPSSLYHAQWTLAGCAALSAETDLMSYAVPHGLLSRDGHHVEALMAFGTAPNANNKRLRIKFGATTFYDSTALALNNIAIVVKVVVIRTSATTQRIIFSVNSSSSLIGTSGQTAGLAQLTESGTPLTLKATGEGVSADDIYQTNLLVRWYPAGGEL